MTLRIINPDILPAFSSVVVAFVDLFTSGSNLRHLLITLYRTFLGLGLGMALGVILALGMARSRWLKTLFEPLLVLTYPLPKPAIIPLTMIWWGVGDFPKIVVVAVGCLRHGVLGADGAAAARPVHHHDLGAELPAHAFGQDARGNVRGAAGGKQHDELDRSRGGEGILRQRRRKDREPCQDRQEPGNKSTWTGHGQASSSFFPR